LSDLSVLNDKNQTGAFDFGPLPRPKSRRMRAKVDRGLPPDEELAKLAREYLERQHKLWPNLVAMGLLPKVDPEVIRSMVEDFKQRHRSAKVGCTIWAVKRHQTILRKAYRNGVAQTGEQFSRKPVSFGAEVHDRIRDLMREGHNAENIAKEVKCSTSAVYYHKKKLRREQKASD
jgi:hypothetical protein